MRAQAGDAARAVRRNPVRLVDVALVPELLEHPPAGGDVAVVGGDVGVVHVQPDAHPLGHGLPLLHVAEDALTAAAVELLDAEPLDLALGGEPQLLLDLQLDGEPVGVPAAAAHGPEAAHGLVAEDDVLEGAREHVVDAGAAVGGRRALVEDERLGVGAQAVDGTEGVVLPPCFEDGFLQGGEVHPARYRLETLLLADHRPLLHPAQDCCPPHATRTQDAVEEVARIKKPVRSSGRARCDPRYHHHSPARRHRLLVSVMAAPPIVAAPPSPRQQGHSP